MERKITLFHADKINRIIAKYRNGIDLIGFHGQTIFHNSEKKISKQLGDGRLLSQLLKKKVIYDFRQDDMKNNGQGAPLTPVFHYLLSKIINKKFKTKLPMVIINIGGITNVTKIIKNSERLE
ncbi:anhydro-N-acetylmuramic acid kinase, partial [Candidatus Pelagibacter sp.]|nr:anhydro-N-acetylmuramic acid kinase [Candidatus Pelagibacter sp.]